MADAEASAQRIAETVLSVPEDTVPIVVAHNGPTNLGSEQWSICGVDFRSRAGSRSSCVILSYRTVIGVSSRLDVFIETSRSRP